MISPLAVGTRLVLASASPARLETLRRAGLDPEVMVSGVDESVVQASTPADLACGLARLKAEAVVDRLGREAPVVVIGCDSVLELDGQALGKPGRPDVAEQRWREMRGRSGVLHTGHHVLVREQGMPRSTSAVGSTTVTFADLDDSEITAYVATGEPLDVAGAFTIDGLGGPYVTSITGDPHNVVGISLPLLRVMLRDLGVAWHNLWSSG